MTNSATTHVLSGAVTGVKFSPDSNRVYVAIGETITVVDVATGAVLQTYDLGLTAQGFDVSPDGQHLAVSVTDGTYDDTAAFVQIDLSNGSMETFTYGSSFSHRHFHDVAFLADGTLLLSHASSAPLRLFDFDAGQYSDASAEIVGSGTLIGSPDGDQVYVVTPSYTQATYIYTLGIGVTATDIPFPDPYAGASLPRPLEAIGAISPSGDAVVRGFDIYNSNLDSSGELNYTFAPRGRGFAFSADGQTLYAADPSGLIIVYEVATWEAVAILDSGSATTTSPAFGDVLQLSSDGTHIAVIGESGVTIVNLALAVPIADNGDNVLDGPGAVVNGTGTLIGLDGNDTLGGAGFQYMYGGRGNDIYHFDRAGERAFEFSGEGYDIIYTQVSAETGQHVEELVYVGTGDAELTGDAGDQTIRGGDGNDTLDGFLGDDVLIGGNGDDTYLAFEAGDLVIEAADGGHDTIETLLAHYVLPDNIERLHQVGSVGGTLVGNRLDNEIVGYVLADYLRGRVGDDVLFGDLGDDLLEGGLGDDVLHGQGDEDYLVGEDGADSLYGGSSSDSLNGGAGNDLLDGGSGVDAAAYALAPSGVFVSLALQGRAQNTRGEGLDTLVSIENLFGSDFGDRLEGDAGANTIDGRDGNDRLLGGADNDRLFGSGGDDRLSGGAGTDRLEGGVGDDLYMLDHSSDVGDIIIEYADGGRDAVRTGFDHTLGENVENLLLLAGDWQGTGNALDNRITAGEGLNTLVGLDGNDVLSGGNDRDLLDGGNGDDRLQGGTGRDDLDAGAGNDRLFGGSGHDRLTGGAGRDRFIFENADALASTVEDSDRIRDFDRSKGDRINLSLIDANTNTAGDDAFAFIGTGAFSGSAGELRYSFDAGRTVIEMDRDGDGLGDLFLRLEGEIDVVARDFYF